MKCRADAVSKRQPGSVAPNLERGDRPLGLDDAPECFHKRLLMRIAELTAYHVLIPLKKPIKHASHARTDTDTLIVRCRLDDGTVGWGEGLPRPYVTGEDITAAWNLISTSNLPQRLSFSWSSLPELFGPLTAFQLPATEQDDRACFGNSVRCAIEVSILDAACRAEGVPLSDVTALVGETAAIRQAAQHVAL